MAETTHPPARRPSPSMVKSGRHVSDTMALWALCPHSVCRKAGQCRKLPLTCLKDCLDFVPGPVGGFAFALFAGKEDRLGFDDALARVPDELQEEFRAWHEAVTRITGRPSIRQPLRARRPARPSTVPTP